MEQLHTTINIRNQSLDASEGNSERCVTSKFARMTKQSSTASTQPLRPPVALWCNRTVARLALWNWMRPVVRWYASSHSQNAKRSFDPRLIKINRDDAIRDSRFVTILICVYHSAPTEALPNPPRHVISPTSSTRQASSRSGRWTMKERCCQMT